MVLEFEFSVIPSQKMPKFCSVNSTLVANLQENLVIKTSVGRIEAEGLNLRDFEYVVCPAVLGARVRPLFHPNTW